MRLLPVRRTQTDTACMVWPIEKCGFLKILVESKMNVERNSAHHHACFCDVYRLPGLLQKLDSSY